LSSSRPPITTRAAAVVRRRNPAIEGLPGEP
jgi:hypothetical protein